MPSEKQRVTAYPDSLLYSKLEKFKKINGCKTLSKAVILALEEFFAIKEEQLAENRSHTLKQLKEEIVQMKIKIEELSKKVEDFE